MEAEETSETVIWISVNKYALIISAAFTLVAFTAASHGNGPVTGDSIGETNFAAPQFDSQAELLSELVAPFLFMTILLQFILSKVLHFVIMDDDIPQGVPVGVPIHNEQRPDVRKYSTLMAITITGILVPSPLWVYVRGAIASIGVLTLAFFVAALLLIMYKVFG